MYKRRIEGKDFQSEYLNHGKWLVQDQIIAPNSWLIFQCYIHSFDVLKILICQQYWHYGYISY